MSIRDNRRGMSGEVMKLGAALLIGLALFSILLAFSFAGEEAESGISTMGEEMLNFSQKSAFDIMHYGVDL